VLSQIVTKLNEVLSAPEDQVVPFLCDDRDSTISLFEDNDSYVARRQDDRFEIVLDFEGVAICSKSMLKFKEIVEVNQSRLGKVAMHFSGNPGLNDDVFREIFFPILLLVKSKNIELLVDVVGANTTLTSLSMMVDHLILGARKEFQLEVCIDGSELTNEYGFRLLDILKQTHASVSIAYVISDHLDATLLKSFSDITRRLPGITIIDLLSETPPAKCLRADAVSALTQQHVGQNRSMDSVHYSVPSVEPIEPVNQEPSLLRWLLFSDEPSNLQRDQFVPTDTEVYAPY
jgi:hypothetical protein